MLRVEVVLLVEQGVEVFLTRFLNHRFVLIGSCLNEALRVCNRDSRRLVVVLLGALAGYLLQAFLQVL